MDISLLTNNLPFVAVAAGGLLFAWSQKDKALKFASNLFWKIKIKKDPTSAKLSPTKRFEIFYALRSWCCENNHDLAVGALDEHVLQAIVLREVESA